MNVIKVARAYKDAPELFFDFKRFEEKAEDFIFIEGRIDFNILEEIKDKKIIYLDLEAPNRFFTSDPQFNRLQFDKYFSIIYSICPYTNDWLNKIDGVDKYRDMFYPTNENYIPIPTTKIYDVIYPGHIVAPEISNIVEDISHFNYRFVSTDNSPLVTDHDVSYPEKLKLISQSKIMVVDNRLFATEKHIKNLIRNAPRWQENIAYSSILETHTAPQLKGRAFEAAFCRSLILCKHDEWNVIEKYFTPNKEFIYYEDNLEETIQKVLDNWNIYKDIAENAYERAIENYTTKHYFEKYLWRL